MGQITRTNFGLSKTFQYTNEEIKALADTMPVLIAGKPGVVILPHLVSFILAPWVADYTNLDAQGNISVNINAVFTEPTYALGALFAQGHAVCAWQEVGRDYDGTPYDYGDLVGESLVLDVDNDGSGPFTGGDASTVLTVQVFYEMLRVPA